MLAQTDCSCATRFRHGMVGGGILDQRQILGQFARNSQCVSETDNAHENDASLPICRDILMAAQKQTEVVFLPD